MSGSATPRGRRDPAGRRLDIMDAALAEFAAKGYHGVATATVALHAGVAIGTVFKIFQTKEGLANAVFCRSADRNEQMADRYPVSQLEEPRRQFRAQWQRLTGFYDAYPLDFRFFEQHSHEAFLAPESRRRQTALRLPIYQWIESLQRDGHLKGSPPQVLAAAVVGPFVRLVRESLAGNVELTTALLGALEDAAWDAIRSP